MCLYDGQIHWNLHAWQFLAQCTHEFFVSCSACDFLASAQEWFTCGCLSMRRRIFGDDANQPDKKLPKRLGFDKLGQAKPKGLTLPERFLRDWAKGDLSSKQIQDYCEGGVVSGCDESTSQFAHLGADGKYAGNIQRD